MGETFGVLSALLANLIGGVFVFKRPANVPLVAWLVFGAVACGQVGLSLRFAGPEPLAMFKFMGANIAIGFVASLALKKFYAAMR